MTTSSEQPMDATDDERAELDSTRESPEDAMREADKANGEPEALDTNPPDGAMPSDADVQAERQR
jgi:hypothetical protein